MITIIAILFNISLSAEQPWIGPAVQAGGHHRSDDAVITDVTNWPLIFFFSASGALAGFQLGSSHFVPPEFQRTCQLLLLWQGYRVGHRFGIECCLRLFP